MSNQQGLDTRHLERDPGVSTAPERDPEVIDYRMPWVIELRVAGTASVVQIQVSKAQIIGRADEGMRTFPDIDLAPFDAHELGVSRHHAVISTRNDCVVLYDLNSSNGTYLNGHIMQPKKEYALQHGDHIMLGKLTLQASFVLMPSNQMTIPLIGSGQRVMIVEDHEQLAYTISAALERAGFEVTVAGTVTEAIRFIDDAMPDAIVLEWMLPDSSGKDLLHYVRQHKAEADIPLIVVSGASGGYQMGQAMGAGANAFLSKPVAIDELMQGVGDLLPQLSA